RALFESGESEVVASQPALARLLETLRDGHTEPPKGNGSQAATRERPVRAVPHEPADDVLLGGVAAAMALVKAIRTHGHLAARLDPLGSEPVGDPALEPERLDPELTPELQQRIPAHLLRVQVKGES